jgi:hypothetical protein
MLTVVTVVATVICYNWIISCRKCLIFLVCVARQSLWSRFISFESSCSLKITLCGLQKWRFKPKFITVISLQMGTFLLISWWTIGVRLCELKQVRICSRCERCSGVCKTWCDTFHQIFSRKHIFWPKKSKTALSFPPLKNNTWNFESAQWLSLLSQDCRKEGAGVSTLWKNHSTLKFLTTGFLRKSFTVSHWMWRNSRITVWTTTKDQWGEFSESLQ